MLTNELQLNLGEVTQKQQERLGFYLFIIESLSQTKDILDIADLVSDTDFNSILFNERYDDSGIDSIVINDEERHIQLFNFKYRDKYSVGKQSVNGTILSSKFINALISEDISKLEGKTRKGAEEIIKYLNGNDE